LTGTAAADLPSELRAFFTTWRRVFGDQPVLVRDVVAQPELHELLDRLAGDGNGEALSVMRGAAWLKSHCGQAVGGLALARHRGAGNGPVRWSLVATGPNGGDTVTEAEWTMVARGSAGLTRRLQVPGGWLFWHVGKVGDTVLGALTFVPGSR
jgi:hypothetical protein